jgi:predicted N-acetyltransferase YhbS
MDTNIRQERPEDYPLVFELIEKAFRDEKYSDHREQFWLNGCENPKLLCRDYRW